MSLYSELPPLTKGLLVAALALWAGSFVSTSFSNSMTLIPAK